MTKGVGGGEEEREGGRESLSTVLEEGGWGKKTDAGKKTTSEGGDGRDVSVCPPKPIKKPFLSRLIKQAHILSGPPLLFLQPPSLILPTKGGRERKRRKRA